MGRSSAVGSALLRGARTAERAADLRPTPRIVALLVVSAGVLFAERASARPGAGALGDAPEEPRAGPANELVIPPPPVPRVRVDVELAGSMGLAPTTRVGGPTVELRLGAQVTDVWSVYYQPQATYAVEAITLLNSLMAEVHVFPVRVGLGPSLDYVFPWCADTLEPTGCKSGPYLGGNARLAVDLGARGSGLGALSVGVDAHPVLYAGAALVFLTLGIAAELN